MRHAQAQGAGASEQPSPCSAVARPRALTMAAGMPNRRIVIRPAVGARALHARRPAQGRRWCARWAGSRCASACWQRSNCIQARRYYRRLQSPRAGEQRQYCADARERQWRIWAIEPQAAVRFSALFGRRQHLPSRAVQRPIGLEGKVPVRKAALLEGQSSLRRAVTTGGSQGANAVVRSEVGSKAWPRSRRRFQALSGAPYRAEEGCCS